MGKYMLRSFGRFLLLMVAVAAVTFALVSLSPVDPLQANVGQAALLGMSEEKRAQLAQWWGVGVPAHERFASWAWGLLHGDWGLSLRYNAPVLDVVASRAVNSLALMAVAWVVSGILGFALGVLAALRRGRLADKLVRGYCFVLASAPTFWVGLLLLMVFSVWLGWFPMGFSVPIGKSAADVTFLDALHHMALPAVTLSLVGVANIALHTRAKAIDVLNSPYVRFARARGQSPAYILRAHGLRNLVLPALTLQFASIAEVFGGSVLVEEVFSYPGLGQAAVTAGLGGDVALLAAIALVSAALVFGGNLLANLLYGLIDPRMSFAAAPRRAPCAPRAFRPRACDCDADTRADDIRARDADAQACACDVDADRSRPNPPSCSTPVAELGTYFRQECESDGKNPPFSGRSLPEMAHIPSCSPSLAELAAYSCQGDGFSMRSADGSAPASGQAGLSGQNGLSEGKNASFSEEPAAEMAGIPSSGASLAGQAGLSGHGETAPWEYGACGTAVTGLQGGKSWTAVAGLKEGAPGTAGLRAAELNAQELPMASVVLGDGACGAVVAGFEDDDRVPVLQAPAVRRVAGRRAALAGCLAAALALMAVVIAGIVLGPEAAATNFAAKNLPPSTAHPFGTDWMGRDMLLRTLAGLSTSVLVGMGAAAASSVIALALASWAALGGKRADAVVSWLVDLLMGIPHIVLLILISYALGKGFWGVTVGVALTHWPSLTRVLRAEILQCRQSDFVQTAFRLGERRLAVALRHMVPYVLPQFIVGLVLLFPHAVLHEAAITFLGFGLPPEMPAIGIILSESMGYLSAGMWWLAVFPGIALVAVVMMFDAVGSGLRRMLDPQTTQE
ncbi:ABC transporter permease subunit [Parvibacter caecicola]|uniref:ABC transporter permease subunit n=2 Tax=Parvibacter caecicola TaxID=747645 RepID=UPI002731C9C6|nr:ABC transporter permease subunit [Parvibacter caecicola]